MYGEIVIFIRAPRDRSICLPLAEAHYALRLEAPLNDDCAMTSACSEQHATCTLACSSRGYKDLKSLIMPLRAL